MNIKGIKNIATNTTATAKKTLKKAVLRPVIITKKRSTPEDLFITMRKQELKDNLSKIIKPITDLIDKKIFKNFK